MVGLSANSPMKVSTHEIPGHAVSLLGALLGLFQYGFRGSYGCKSKAQGSRQEQSWVCLKGTSNMIPFKTKQRSRVP